MSSRRVGIEVCHLGDFGLLLGHSKLATFSSVYE